MPILHVEGATMTIHAAACRRKPSAFAKALMPLAGADGVSRTSMADVRLVCSRAVYPRVPISYEASIVIIAQGYKVGYLGTHASTYDAHRYLVLPVPLPFEIATYGSQEEPMLGLAIRVDPATVAGLLLELDGAAVPVLRRACAIDAVPLTPALSEAALRLARCLHSPMESRVLGPLIIREITYHALCGGQGAWLREAAAPLGSFYQIAKSLRRIHRDYAQTLSVSALAREAGMSVSTFHAHFKAVTAKPPLHYLQTVRLHKARVLVTSGLSVSVAARQVGYGSSSQFSREFKRLFGVAPKQAAKYPASGSFAF